jgi:regulator of replication initiation timing
MTTGELFGLLDAVEKKLRALATEARKTRDQAGHTVEQLKTLRAEVDVLRLQVMARADTLTLPALPSQEPSP